MQYREGMALRITWNGRLVLTTAQAAQRYGLTLGSMRSAIKRLAFEPVPETLDARTPLYLASELDAAIKARPGKGNRS
jgi:hypothetical protein